MEKGFRTVQCPPPCGQKLRIKITKEQYGMTLDVHCPKCYLTFPTTIPVPAERVAGEASDPFETPFDDSPLDVLGDIDEMFSEGLRNARKELEKRFGRKR